jgi:Helix-turn-helix domain
MNTASDEPGLVETLPRWDREPDPADAVHWRSAATLHDLGVLTARWLDGDIAFLPSYGAAGPDPETEELVPMLAPLNRAGFVTTNSQPGVPAEDGSCQRAFIEGFCDDELASAILGIGRTKAYELAKTGGFPVTILPVGRRYLVPTNALHTLLGA